MQPSTSVPVIRRVLLALLVVLIVGATFVGGRRLGMSTRVTTRHEFYSIPCAISRLYFNTRGYVILGDVDDLFIAAHPNVTDETLQQSLSLDPRRDRLMFFPADDKGSADFVTLSFLMFGLNIEGLYYAWFVMFAVPIA